MSSFRSSMFHSWILICTLFLTFSHISADNNTWIYIHTTYYNINNTLVLYDDSTCIKPYGYYPTSIIPPSAGFCAQPHGFNPYGVGSLLFTGCTANGTYTITHYTDSPNCNYYNDPSVVGLTTVYQAGTCGTCLHTTGNLTARVVCDNPGPQPCVTQPPPTTIPPTTIPTTIPPTTTPPVNTINVTITISNTTSTDATTSPTTSSPTSSVLAPGSHPTTTSPNTSLPTTTSSPTTTISSTNTTKRSGSITQFHSISISILLLIASMVALFV